MKAFLVACGVVVLTALFILSVYWLAESGVRGRDCFHAGGKIIDGVCMPVENAIKLEKETSGN